MTLVVEKPVIVTGETIVYDKVSIDSLNISVDRADMSKITVVLLFTLYGTNKENKRLFEENQRSIIIPDYKQWASEQTALGDTEAENYVNNVTTLAGYLIQKLGNLGSTTKL